MKAEDERFEIVDALGDGLSVVQVEGEGEVNRKHNFQMLDLGWNCESLSEV